MRIVIAVLFLAGGVWAGWWFFGVFNANLASPGGLLMGGLMVLLPIIGLLSIAGIRKGRAATERETSSGS